MRLGQGSTDEVSKMADFLVYVAGPTMHSSGVLEQNVREGIAAADLLRSHGAAVFVPHLNMLWNLMHTHDTEFWMENDLEILSRCDALLRLPGKSAGADREVELCRTLGIPVFARITDVIGRMKLQGPGGVVAEVRRYACGRCGTVYEDRMQAADCCTPERCSRCKGRLLVGGPLCWECAQDDQDTQPRKPIDRSPYPDDAT